MWATVRSVRDNNKDCLQFDYVVNFQKNRQIDPEGVGIESILVVKTERNTFLIFSKFC